MTREAALLGVPTLSVFGGAAPAADRWLEARGLLRMLSDAREIDAIGPRATPRAKVERSKAHGEALVRLFADQTLAAAR